MSFRVAITSTLIAAGGLACVSSHFAQLDRPVVMRDVAIGLLDERCTYRPTPARPEQPALNVEVTMQVRNTGLLDATFAPGGISLLADRTELPAMATDETTIIRPGFTRTFTLRFEGPEPIGCDAPMAVVLDRALEPPRSETAKHVLRFRGRAFEAPPSRTTL